MSLIYNIRTLSRYERLALRRSWFLRIFVFLGLVILFFINLDSLTDVYYSPSWFDIALPATIPYRNLLMINLGQSIVAVFLAADFLKRDNKLDTAEVVYSKPVSNLEYIFGKVWGNIHIFLVIDLLLLGMVAVFNLISKGADFDIPAYGEYLLLVVVPSLVFVIGLSVLVMSLVRNQAVTFLIMLGFIALDLFYLKARFHYLFDFMGREVPMMRSGIIGFDHPETFLYQRAVFFLSGLSFLFFSVFLMRRLPRHWRERVVSLGVAFLLLGAALGSGYRHLQVTGDEVALRQRLRMLNDRYAVVPAAKVTRHDIRLKHHGREIQLSSHMTLRNDHDTLLPVLVMSLNPGLTISRVTSGGKSLTWKRELHLLQVTPPRPLAPGDTLSLTLDYGGSPDDRICYPDIDTFRMPHKLGTVKVPSAFGFVTSRYVLLTPELVWYPVTGTTYSPHRPEWYRKDFIRFRLHVESADSLTPVSQGTARKEGGGTTFQPAMPLPQISLSMGDYVMRSLMVDSIGRKNDSILFRVYTTKGHDYYVGSLPGLTEDTLKLFIRKAMSEYEGSINLDYPFSVFSLVEVPVQFHSYQHLWSGAMENVQPEIVYMEEKGAPYYSADLYGTWKNYKRWSKYSRESHTDKDHMVSAYNSFLHLFFSRNGTFNFSWGAGGQSSVKAVPNPVNIFPEYFTYRLFLSSGKWPVVNRILESYLTAPVVGTGNDWLRRYAGLSEDEKANIALQEKSFHDLLTDLSKTEILDNAIKLKGEMLFLAVKAHMENGAMVDTFLYKWLDRHWFASVPFDTLATALERLSRYPLREYMKEWYYTTRLPGYLFSDITLTNVVAGDRMRQLFEITVANPEDEGGIVKIVFTDAMGKNILHPVWFEPHQTKKIRYLLDRRPSRVYINSMISRNIPMIIYPNLPEAVREVKYLPATGEQVIPNEDFHYIPEGTILVDNEDPGFSLIEPGTQGLFYKLLTKSKETGEKYAGFSWWRPINWTLTTGDAFYGKYVRSAWFVRSGKGTHKALWKVNVSEPGYYTVYYYLNYRKFRYGSRGRNHKYEFTIRYGDVTEERSLDLKDSRAGWNSLGFYRFPDDTAVIELSDKSTYRVVVADAVKLVKE